MKKLLPALLLLPLLAWAAENPFNGTWKWDPNTVQFPTKPESWVLQNGRYQCSTCVPPLDIKADGTDQPTPGTKLRDTSAVKIVNDKTVEMTDKKGGKVIETDKFTVSEDGKTMTIEFTEYPEASKQPVTGKLTLTRVTKGPAGSHTISGSWRAEKFNSISENSMLFTYKASADGLQMSSMTGESYDAKYDGKDYLIKGDRAGTMVSLKKLNENAIDEILKRDGKVVSVNHVVISTDGKKMTMTWEDKEHGTTTTSVAIKQ